MIVSTYSNGEDTPPEQAGERQRPISTAYIASSSNWLGHKTLNLIIVGSNPLDVTIYNLKLFKISVIIFIET